KGDDENASLKATVASNNRLSINIKNWSVDKCDWTQSTTTSASIIKYNIAHLNINNNYSILLNNNLLKKVKPNNNGSIMFECPVSGKASEITITNEQAY